MLILTRKEEETIKATITVDDLRELLRTAEHDNETNIELFAITVVKIRGTTARLGCDGPRVVHFIRGELQPHDATKPH